MPVMAFGFVAVLVAAVVASLVVAAGAILIYRREIEKDHPDCWWEEGELRRSDGSVCTYVGRQSRSVIPIPLEDIQLMLGDDDAECPPVLRLHLCEFRSEGRIVVRAIALP